MVGLGGNNVFIIAGQASQNLPAHVEAITWGKVTTYEITKNEERKKGSFGQCIVWIYKLGEDLLQTIYQTGCVQIDAASPKRMNELKYLNIWVKGVRRWTGAWRKSCQRVVSLLLAIGYWLLHLHLHLQGKGQCSRMGDDVQNLNSSFLWMTKHRNIIYLKKTQNIFYLFWKKTKALTIKYYSVV